MAKTVSKTHLKVEEEKVRKAGYTAVQTVSIRQRLGR